MTAGPRALQIGDVEPVPLGANLELAKGIQAQRGKIAQAARSNSRRAHAIAARAIMREHAEIAFRLSDPLERAKTFLRRRGYAPVCQMRERLFTVGSRQFTSDQEVMEFARSRGWRD